MDTNQVIRVTNDWSTEMRKYYLNATRRDHTQSGPWVQLIINKDSSRDNFVWGKYQLYEIKLNFSRLVEVFQTP